MIASIQPLVIFLAITLLTAFLDSQAFVNAANIWRANNIDWPALGRSITFFLMGIGTYLISLRFLHQLGINTPEIQVTLWFAVTLIGVALVSGRFFQWPPLEQFVGVLVFSGLVWLLWRVGE